MLIGISFHLWNVDPQLMWIGVLKIKLSFLGQIASGKNSDSETVKSSQIVNTVILTDSIAKGIRMKDFNRYLQKNPKVKLHIFYKHSKI